MKRKIAFVMMAAMMTAPMAASPVAAATTYHGKKQVHHSYRCKKSKGTTGAIAGGVGGAVAGGALIGGPIAVVAGAAGGALLGKHLDKKHDAAQNRRNGC